MTATMLKKMTKPIQSRFWMPRSPNPYVCTNKLRRSRLELAEREWLNKYSEIPNIGVKINSFDFCDPVFPNLSDDQLLTSMKYFDWFFYFDDQFDFDFDNEMCRRQSHDILDGIKTGTFQQYRNESLNAENVNMFEDILDEMMNWDNPDVSNQFYLDLKWYFDSADWMISAKQMYKNTQKQISFAEYLNQRSGDCGLWPLLCLMYSVYDEFNYDNGIVKAINQHPIVQKIKLASGTHCAMVNDILSFNKDIDEDTGLNAILLLHKENVCLNQEDAVTVALDICNNKFIELCVLIDVLKREQFYVDYKEPLDIFFNVCENVLIQHIQWYYKSPRYD